MPSTSPRYTISSDLGESLLVHLVRGIKMVCPTSKHSHRRDVWFFARECFKGCTPIKVFHRSPIVAVHGVFYRKLPPGLRNAGFNSHCTFLIHDGVVKPLSTSILLGGIWYALKDFNPFCLEDA